jgi:hypothetical protein
MSRRRCAALAIAMTLCAAMIAWGQGNSSKVSWTVRPTKTRFKRSEQIILAYELKNLSASQILVGSSPHVSGEMQLELTGQDGEKVLWQGAVAATGPSFQFTLLGPGRSLAATVAVPLNCNVSSFQGGYCLDKAGKYTGTVLYQAPSYEFIKSIGCGSAFVKGPYRSDRFEFEIE